MDRRKPLNPFDAAQTAFEIRFENELTAHWEELELAAAKAVDESPSGSKRNSLLKRFFDEAGNRVAEDIHSYFPKLLQLGLAHPKQLGTISVLGWTSAGIRRQVCHFLGMDEKFDMEETVDSGVNKLREESRVLRSALVISTNNWAADGSSLQLRLPAWAGHEWLACGAISLPRSASDWASP